MASEVEVTRLVEELGTATDSNDTRAYINAALNAAEARGEEKKRVEVVDHFHLGLEDAAARVESWRDNFIRETRGLRPLLLVGGKVLYADETLTNIAIAIREIPFPIPDASGEATGDALLRKKGEG